MNGPDGRPARARSGSGTGRVLVYVSVALAVAAAAVLVLGFDDPRLLRLGIVAALWAALAGSFAAARVRREATSAANQTEDLRAIYQLELEREVAARREHELTVERELRRDIEHGSRAELDALRAELRTLRRNLESVLGGELLVERVALRAESTRMRSLPAQPPSAPYQGREDGRNPPQRAAGLSHHEPAARADPARRPQPGTPHPGTPQPAPTTDDEDPLFGALPCRSDPSNSNGAPARGNGNGNGNGMAGLPPNGAHPGKRSVEELLAAHGAGAAPRRRHRRDDG
ncbi:MAG: hypothetical protein GEU83_13600 [Pseudonocardiaceae bacterium]|nr:hypothetical protein [Pseudonocardiaceae bacterium]